MVDFSKRLKKQNIIKKINPYEIYQNIDRHSTTGPLRPAQESILKRWYENKRDEKDLIIKLHTGEGKTLIGLLILQSKLNSNDGPCIYVCPNIYLVKQVCEEAEKFGIKYCCIDKDNEIPNDAQLGKSILITHVQKIFNGKTIFGLDSESIHAGCVILDDSHACIDSINDSFIINITKKENKEVYNEILELFENDLIEQGEGTLIDIKNEEYDSLLPIPYWAWNSKKRDILKILANNKDITSIDFAWPLLKNDIHKCKAYITGDKIEISPYSVPISRFGTFHLAKNRILMSATTQNDSFFIKGLGFSLDAVREPLTYNDQKWSGEKMILIPSLINEELDRGKIVNFFGKERNNNIGIVALVSSFNKTKLYEKLGSTIVKTNDIFEKIKELKNGERNKTVVIVNRYDGIDLPDDSCRVLIVDSLPFFNSLSDRYEKLCRPSSESVNRKIAQRIEQGFGRSVRGEKDYSSILVIGNDIVQFVKSIKTNKYFSHQTRKQIDIGIEISELSKEDLNEGEDPIKVIVDLVNQSLKRDEGWKEYYKEVMNELVDESNLMDMYDVLLLENKAEQLYNLGEYDKACNIIQKIIDDKVSDDWERGWYLQLLSRYKYNISIIESNELQKRAFIKNNQLLKPREGISYSKIESINESRIGKIKDVLLEFKDFNELNLTFNSIMDDLSFGGDSDKFEAALMEVGRLLGFKSQRPDKLIRKGPDNLWAIGINEYMMFECKNQVKESRKEISKYEAGQMNSHCAWFEKEYGEAKVKRLLIIPTKDLEYSADFTHDVQIIRKGKLRELKSSLKNFIKELKMYDIRTISDEKINKIIDFYKLDTENLKNFYSEEYHHKTK